MAIEATLKLNGKTVFVEFICRYKCVNDYRVHLGGGATARVSRDDDGTIKSCSDQIDDVDAVTCVQAYLAAEELEYERWKKAHPHLRIQA